MLRVKGGRGGDCANFSLFHSSFLADCLNDLLFRLSSKSLPIEVPLIVSNHADYAPLAAAHGIPFYHLPIDVANGKTKEWQEEQLIGLCEQYDVELVVLARYMQVRWRFFCWFPFFPPFLFFFSILAVFFRAQILSPKLCSLMSGRIINIHHSFLPSFKGAKPYHQAFERGVKLIGATAHFVTSDLDEGPIIEQAVERVNHNMTPAELVRAGADVEARVLARAVRWTAERRVLANGGKVCRIVNLTLTLTLSHSGSGSGSGSETISTCFPLRAVISAHSLLSPFPFASRRPSSSTKAALSKCKNEAKGTHAQMNTHTHVQAEPHETSAADTKSRAMFFSPTAESGEERREKGE